MPVRSSLEIVFFSRHSNGAIKRKRNPQTDTFRRLIDQMCYFLLSRGESSNFDQSLEKFKFTEERFFGERETSKYMIRNTKQKKKQRKKKAVI